MFFNKNSISLGNAVLMQTKTFIDFPNIFSIFKNINKLFSYLILFSLFNTFRKRMLKISGMAQ